jgi:nicotinamide-nucleotide amidase
LVERLARNEDPDWIDSGGTIWIAIVTTDQVAFRFSRILGGRKWVRLGAVELALGCLRRFLHGLPVVERIDFEKS